MKIETTTNKLREILKTINTRIIKEIEIKECSNHSLLKMCWYEVTIGVKTYIVGDFDMRTRFARDAVSYFEQTIKEFSESLEHSELIIKRTRY